MSAELETELRAQIAALQADNESLMDALNMERRANAKLRGGKVFRLESNQNFDCHKCHEKAGVPIMRMILCPTCGNKRCPKASDHENECTGSNASGQAGSVY